MGGFSLGFVALVLCAALCQGTHASDRHNRFRSALGIEYLTAMILQYAMYDRDASFEKGDKVRISAGKFKGKKGTIKRRLESRGKWGVKLDEGTKTAVSSGNLDILKIPAR